MSAEPVLPEPVAWRGLTQSYPYPQDNDWRYGPWVYDLDPAKYKPLFTSEQMLAFFKAGREQGLREAAQKCETRGKTGRYKARRVEALDLAFEIRSMAEGSATRSGCEENP